MEGGRLLLLTALELLFYLIVAVYPSLSYDDNPE
jgi:hypothetical protein